MRHGKFIEWQTGGRRYALTGSANLTRAALGTSTRDGGNCELAVLAADTLPLLPEEGRIAPLASLVGCTIRPFTSNRSSLVLLGAKTDSEGLHVSLARSQPLPVAISTSPDGSPSSWTEIGFVPPGALACSSPQPEVPGTQVAPPVSGGTAAPSIARCLRLQPCALRTPPRGRQRAPPAI